MQSSPGTSPNPLISVFMSARNAGAYLALAVASILDQSLSDFEFLIIDDASTDNTWELLSSFGDPRLKVYRNDTQQGQSANYNRLIQQSGGRYLAKMDADDISLPERFRIQVDFLESHPEIWACSGTYKLLIGENLYDFSRICDPAELRVSMAFNNGLAHPFMMLRGDIWRQHDLLYDLKSRFSQDYEFWLRILMNYPEASFTNVPEIIGIYRQHEGSISIRHMAEQKKCAARAQMCVFKKLGFSPLDPDIKNHYILHSLSTLESQEELAGVVAWVNRLREANNVRQVFDPDLFNRYLQGYLLSLVSSEPKHIKYYNALKKAETAVVKAS